MTYSFNKIILLVITFLIPLTGISQANKRRSFSISLGPEVYFPEKAFRKTHNAGYGGSVKAEYTFGKHASVTLNSGFSVFSGKANTEVPLPNTTNYKRLTVIPVKSGFRYYLGDFYFFSEAGIIFLNEFANSNNLTLAAGIGDKIRIGRKKIDISVRQEIWINTPANFNTLNFRIAYEFLL